MFLFFKRAQMPGNDPIMKFPGIQTRANCNTIWVVCYVLYVMDIKQLFYQADTLAGVWGKAIGADLLGKPALIGAPPMMTYTFLAKFALLIIWMVVSIFSWLW